MRDTVNDLAIWVAGVFFIETAQGGFEVLGIAGLEWSGHAPDYSRSGFGRKADLPPGQSIFPKAQPRNEVVSMMMAAAAVAAGFILKIRLSGNAAQFERFGNALLDRVLDFVQFLLRVQKSARDGIGQQVVPVLFKVGNFRAFERLHLGLFFLNGVALVHHRFILAAGLGVGQKSVNALADGNHFRLFNDDLAKFPGLFFDFRRHKFDSRT
jgi:hypothetical protein